MNSIIKYDETKLQALQFEKYADNLVPCIIQDPGTGIVLMLGFMSRESLDESLASGKACFYSRSKQRLWTKGESSGMFLRVQEILFDCDDDTILMKVIPAGPVCHLNTDTCFGEANIQQDFLYKLEDVIASRLEGANTNSYTKTLFDSGINKIAQKLGEEAVELIIESKDNDRELFLNEAADLLFHYLLLLRAKSFRLEDVVDVLEKRHEEAK